MGRKLVALCAAALLAATAACGPSGDDGPDRHRVLLPEPAPASAAWILEAVASVPPPTRCPAPTPATLGVLDSDDREHRYVVAFWLVDDVDVCWVVIDPSGDRGIGRGPIDGLATEQPAPADQTPGHDSYAFAVFPGRVDGLYATGTDHLLGPLHSRAVDLGGGRYATFASYGIHLPENGQSVTVHLCPPPGGCREGGVAHLNGAAPSAP
ncbi:hypothetical protein [Kitasatospora sp. NPDC004289]